MSSLTNTAAAERSSAGVFRLALRSLEPRRALVLVLAAFAALAVATDLAWRAHPTELATPPAFLADALGAPDPKAQSGPEGAPLQVALLPAGYSVSDDIVGRTSLRLEGAESGTWERFEGGAFRETAFGSETITFDGRGAEQFLTIEERQGERRWRWRIEARGFVPRQSADGSVDLDRPSGLSAFTIPPVAVYDLAGRDVTPAGLRWQLAERNGVWWLELELDDAKLPLPYVIDPGIVLRAAASAENGSGATTLTVSKPAGVAEGDLLLAQISVRSGSNNTITAPAGWTQIQNTTNGTALRQAVYWRTAGAGEGASYTWTFSLSRRASGGIVAYSGVETTNPIDASSSATGSGSAVTATGVTTTVANAILAGYFGIARSVTFTPPGGTAELFDVTSSGSGSAGSKVASEGVDALQAAAGASGSKTATASAGDSWVAHLVALVPDTTSPATATSAPTEVTGAGNQYYDAVTKTQWFRPGGSGSFTLAATATDTAGNQKVAFPTVSGVSGWTGSTGGDDFSSPYASPVAYAWTAGASPPGARTITGYDFAGNTGTDTVTIAADSTAPTGTSASLSGGPWYSSLSVPLSLSSGSDAESGLDATSAIVERDSALLANGTCGSFSGTWTTVTLSGGADTTVAAGTCYRYRYAISDHVGNQSVSTASADAKVDVSAPGAPTLTLAESPADPDQHAAGSTLYYRPGAGGGSFTVSATASDTESGMGQVTFPVVPGVAGGGPDVSSPYSATYTWDSGTSIEGAQSAAATNGTGASSPAATFSLAQDSAAPSGGSLTYSGGWNTTGSVAVTTSSGTDSGSGVDAASSVLERSTSPLSGGACGAFGSWSVTTSPDTVASGLCARYRYTVSDNTGNSVTYTSGSTVLVDTTAPAATMTDPGANLSGTVSLGSVALDPESGIATSVYERSPAGAGTWTSTPTPWNTTTGPDGLYDLRVVATNAAGLQTTSVVANRLVDNTAPGGGGGSAGSYLRGIATLTASPDDPGGSSVSSVSFRYRPSGPGPFTSIGTDSEGSDGWSISWDTTTVPEGPYDLEALVSDAAANQATLSLGTKTVDNTPPAASVTPGSPDPTISTTATFNLSSTEAGSTFECRLDGSSFVACASPQTYADLAWGAHTLEVRATDPAGNASSQASYGWTSTPPDTVAPEAAARFRGELDDDGLTLRWDAARDDSGRIASYLLFVGDNVLVIDGGQLHAKLGPFGFADARRFTLAAVDETGNVGPRTPSLGAVPELVGLSPAAAAATLAAHGFTAGPTREEVSESIPAGLVVRAGGSGIAAEGEVLTLVVSAGAPGRAPEGPLVRQVKIPEARTWLRQRSMRVEILLSRGATVEAVLFGPRWTRIAEARADLSAGASTLEIQLPGQPRPGRYFVRVRAEVPGSYTVERRLRIAPVRRVAVTP